MNLPIEAEIRSLEEQLGNPVVRASADLLASLVSEEFMEFGSSGRIYTKREVMDQLVAAPSVTLTFTDFRVITISPGVALATYRTAKSLRSSLWRREGEYWRIVFHQGTPTAADL